MVIIGYAELVLSDEKYYATKDFCEQRIEYLSTITDPKRKKQSVAVWLLLHKVLTDLGIDVNAQTFTLLPSGKWVSGGIYFSLSHSDNFVAVSASKTIDNSIDVQACKQSVLNVINKRLKNKGENDKIMCDIIEATTQWTRLELQVKGVFDITKSFVIEDAIGDNYVLSYSHQDAPNLKTIIKKYTLL